MINTKLSVLIPTYNRAESLLKTIAILEPQCVEHCVKIVVVDNASKISAKSLIQENFSNPNLHWEVITNSRNIGGNANLCRCFELCNTSWMWLLGDDDTPNENSILAILAEIELNDNNCCMINFSSSMHCFPNSRNLTLKEVSNSFSDPKYFSNFLFISTSVYKIDLVIEELPFAYHSAYSCAPQLILPLLSLAGNKSSISDSEFKLVEWTPPPSHEAWNQFLVLLGFTTLADHPLLRSNHRVITRNAIKCNLGKSRGYIKWIARTLLSSSCSELSFWSTAYTRIGCNLAIIDKIVFFIASRAAFIMSLTPALHGGLARTFKLSPPNDNLSRS